jgi:hypothetical protein
MLQSNVWLLDGITGSASGVLRLGDGRLTFHGDDGTCLINVRIAELTTVKFPWYYFGGGMQLRVGDVRHRISFTRPGNLPEAPWDLRGALATGRAWKAALANSMQSRRS